MTFDRKTIQPLDIGKIKHVVSCINRDIVPDKYYDRNTCHISAWFEKYFSFLRNPNLEKHLGEAFHQSRLLYKTMIALRLPQGKMRGFVKFEIIQYAAICEAIIDYSIEHFFKADAEIAFCKIEYSKCSDVLTSETTITHDGENIFLCRAKKKKVPLKCVRITERLDLVVRKNLISTPIRDRIENLYDTRNNVHILKAAMSNYIPKITEAKEAFLLMQDFVNEVKKFYTQNPS